MIPFCDIGKFHDHVDLVSEPLKNGWISPGDFCKKFSDAISKYTKVPGVLLTTSGTTALQLAAKALGLRPGDQILIPAYGYVATINAFASLHMRPKLVDIDPRTGCMDPSAMEAAIIRGRTKAVCFVNFSGYTDAKVMTEIRAICDHHDLKFIEDSACGVGHWAGSKHAGNFGDISILSFSPPKIVTTGEGGAILTSDLLLFEKVRKLIDQGDPEKQNDSTLVGVNAKFNDILAAFGLSQFNKLEATLANKQKIHDIIKKELGTQYFVCPSGAPLHNIVFSQNPNSLVEKLNNCGLGIMARRQYKVIHDHTIYRYLSGMYPNARIWSDHAVYLPFGNSLSHTDADMMAQQVKEYLNVVITY